MTTKNVSIEMMDGGYMSLIIDGDVWYNSNHQLVMHENNDLSTVIYVVDGHLLKELKNDDTSVCKVLSDRVQSVHFLN